MFAIYVKIATFVEGCNLFMWKVAIFVKIFVKIATKLAKAHQYMLL